MSNSLDEDNDLMKHGISQLLGKEEYDAPTRSVICEHVSDGFIYEETPTFITRRCTKCGLHYDENLRYGYKV